MFYLPPGNSQGETESSVVHACNLTTQEAENWDNWISELPPACLRTSKKITDAPLAWSQGDAASTKPKAGVEQDWLNGGWLWKTNESSKKQGALQEQMKMPSRSQWERSVDIYWVAGLCSR